MISYAKARKLADTWVELVSDGEGAVVDQATLARPYGWVFSWQSKVHLAAKEPQHLLAGNAPIIVDRVDFEVRVTGTAKSLEHYLRQYEATLPPARLEMTPEEPPPVRGS